MAFAVGIALLTLLAEPKVDHPWTYRGLQIQPTHFLEPTRIAYVPLPSDEAAVGADIAPHLFFINTLADRYAEQLDAVASGRTPRAGWAFALAFTPRIHARLFRGNSFPVRTPSYIGHVDMQAFHTQVRFAAGMPRAIVLHGVLFAFGHHSNGQDGCLKTNETGSVGHCRVDPEFPSSEPVEWNTRNGDFSTNYLRLGYGFKHVRLSPFGDAYRPSSFYDFSAAFEAHPYPTGDTRTFLRHEIGEYYGPYRVSLGASVSQLVLVPRLRTAVLLTAAFDATLLLPFTPKHYASYRVVPELRATLPGQGGIGLFVRGVFGQDDYNIHFVEPRFGCDIGVVVDLGTGDSLRRR
jgi:hypothetical protein